MEEGSFMILIICGLPGAGKSTLVEKLAEKHKLKTVFASSILKDLKDKNAETIDVTKTKKGEGWWESPAGKKYNQERLKNLQMDKQLDGKLLEIIGKKDNLIIDSRTMPWLAKKKGLVKIWIDASPSIRAKRVAERDDKDWKLLLIQMKERLETDKKIYKKLYGIEFGKDFKPFDVVLNTDKLDKQEVFEEVDKKIQRLITK
ncbi:MAG: hypothetical protein COT15_01705 [Candidatus Diapherotrites archaeon CG08_land_8_20_14_0_20_34_12]|nr:MAG: hypothetical protein COT15_01705 [Candidatus Diapherotrites archaeon CG08_land_8_20_14_0_20_34_12]